MNKKILTVLLPALLITNTPAYNSTSNKIDTTQITTSSPNNQTTDIVSEKSIFHNYDDILKRYQDLLSNKHNEKNVQTDQLYSDQNNCAIEEALQTTVINSGTSMMGYAICDINGDGQTELFLMDEHYHIYAVFSQRNDNPILLDTFLVNNHYVSLDQNGIFYQTGYGKGENSYTKIMRIANSGDFEVLLEYGCSDDGTDYQYYVIENHVKRIIDLQEITILQEKYHSFLQNPSETTKSSGLQFIPVMGKCDIGSAKINVTFDSYDSIINIYKKMVEITPDVIEEKKINNEEVKKTFDIDESKMDWFSQLTTSISILYPKDAEGLKNNGYTDFGYAVKDVNGDGVDELFLMLSDGTIIAAFSIHNNKPVLLETFRNRYMCSLNSVGDIFISGSNGAMQTVNRRYTIDSTTDDLKLIGEYGTEGFDYITGEPIFYVMIDSVKTYITKQEYDDFCKNDNIMTGSQLLLFLSYKPLFE